MINIFMLKSKEGSKWSEHAISSPRLTSHSVIWCCIFFFISFPSCLFSMSEETKLTPVAGSINTYSTLHFVKPHLKKDMNWTKYWEFVQLTCIELVYHISFRPSQWSPTMLAQEHGLVGNLQVWANEILPCPNFIKCELMRSWNP